MPTVVDMSKFDIGSHVKIKGIMKYSHFPYLWVQSEHDVTLASGEKTNRIELSKGSRSLKRICVGSSNETVVNCKNNIYCLSF